MPITKWLFLAPDKIKIKREMLFDDLFSYCQCLKKLLPNIFDKEYFVLQYENLQF